MRSIPSASRVISPLWPGLPRPSTSLPSGSKTWMPGHDGKVVRSRTRPVARSPRAKFLRQHENLARARDLGPAAVPFGDQRLQHFPAQGAIERGLVGELVTRLMQRGIAHAPEPPCLLRAKRLQRVGQMLAVIPLVKRLAFSWIGDGCADNG